MRLRTACQLCGRERFDLGRLCPCETDKTHTWWTRVSILRSENRDWYASSDEQTSRLKSDMNERFDKPRAKVVSGF
jgi:hypothetical protein